MDEQRGVRVGFGRSVLTFSDPVADDYGGSVKVGLHVEGLDGARRVQLPTGPTSLIDYLRWLGEHWRGWDGTKGWQNDDDFRIEATHDAIGAVVLHVELGRVPPLEWQRDGWGINATLVVEPGSLARAADDLEKLILDPLSGR